jgi:hypothetical protein
MFAECGNACKRMIKVFGKSRLVSNIGPDDFATLRRKMAKTWGAEEIHAALRPGAAEWNIRATADRLLNLAAGQHGCHGKDGPPCVPFLL